MNTDLSAQAKDRALAAALASIARSGLDGLSATDVGRIVARDYGLDGYLSPNQLSARGRYAAEELIKRSMVYSVMHQKNKRYHVN